MNGFQFSGTPRISQRNVGRAWQTERNEAGFRGIRRHRGLQNEGAGAPFRARPAILPETPVCLTSLDEVRISGYCFGTNERFSFSRFSTSVFMTLNSTRRFLAMPSCDVFVPIGCVSP